MVQCPAHSWLDGTQGEAVSASADDKLKICKRLAAFGVDYIEAGWPGSNPKDVEFFAKAAADYQSYLQQQPTTAQPPHFFSRLVAFGSTRRKGITAAADPQVQALLDSGAPTICLVAKSQARQVTDILRTTLEENLAMIHDTVSYLVKRHDRTVLVDLEHFFDGYAQQPDYVLACAQTAVDAGASCLVLCDTNGATMPWTMTRVCQQVVQQFATTSSSPVTIGIHCHNDCGMAVANSLSAVQVGIGLVQGTINGIGERTGNADLCAIVPTLALHHGEQPTVLQCRDQLPTITGLSRYVDEILNRTPNHAAPYVGASAFAHKGGLHVAALQRDPSSYQHVDPAAVGNERRVLVSELSGRQNIVDKMTQVTEQFGVDVTMDRATAILQRVKELEAVGYTFEGADASVQLMILHSTRGYCPPFQVLDYSAHVYDANLDSASRILLKNKRSTAVSSTSSSTARATIKVRTIKRPDEFTMDEPVDELSSLPYHDRLEVGEGNGPVDALARALNAALLPAHPYLSTVELVDYKVRILDPGSATQATTRVLIEFRDTAKETTWTTVSVDTNVISASLNALIDGYEFALIEYADSCLLCDDAF
jgi:2-isopropylmalate synthase